MFNCSFEDDFIHFDDNLPPETIFKVSMENYERTEPAWDVRLP